MTMPPRRRNERVRSSTRSDATGDVPISLTVFTSTWSPPNSLAIYRHWTRHGSARSCDAHAVPARHLANEVERVLAGVACSERRKMRLEIVNRLLSELRRAVGESENRGDAQGAMSNRLAASYEPRSHPREAAAAWSRRSARVARGNSDGGVVP